MRHVIRLLLASLVGWTAGPTWAQWSSQTIALKPGWNAVFLEIQPEPRDCATIFANLPVESVWYFNRRFEAIQFIDDPNQLLPNQPDWLTYLPPTDPLGRTSKLFVIEGGKPYLIKLSAHANPVEWAIRGRVVLSRPKWLADSYNFVGFPLIAGATPTLQVYFAGAKALANGSIYRLGAQGNWTKVADPAATPMLRGEAFWIQTSGSCDYPGTFGVETDWRAGLDFGTVLTEQTLRVRNYSGNAATITLQPVTSDQPSSSYPTLAGPVPLSYWVTDGNGVPSWVPLSAPISQTLGAGGVWELRLAVRRRDMASFSPTAGVEAQYQSVLQVSDGRTRLLVPVTSEGPSTSRIGLTTVSRFGVSASQSGSSSRAGLWIGTAMINAVNQPSASSAPAIPQPTASTFQFRILVHLDAQGQARLLQKVMQRWADGTTEGASDVPGAQRVVTPGRAVLLTDETLAKGYKGASLRDGESTGRRISSPAFSFPSPIDMTASNNKPFGTAGAVYKAQIQIGYSDALNPFLHRYHPDHDNLNDRGGLLPVQDNDVGPYTTESSSIRRGIELQFTDEDPNAMTTLAGWGDTRIGGAYKETITGLHKDPLIATGTFQLFKASATAVLNQ